jgi:hypothetical protein
VALRTEGASATVIQPLGIYPKGRDRVRERVGLSARWSKGAEELESGVDEIIGKCESRAESDRKGGPSGRTLTLCAK